MQQLPNFIAQCRYIQEHISDGRNEAMRLHHRLATLLLSPSLLDYLRLSLLCMVRRKEIYFPASKAEGIRGMMHGFFHPIIFAYYSSFNFK